jgi:hypothetical protein
MSSELEARVEEESRAAWTQNNDTFQQTLNETEAETSNETTIDVE